MSYKISLSQNVTLNRTDGKSVLFSKKTGSFFGLNRSADEIVTALFTSDADRVVEEISTRFQVPRADVARDVGLLVDSLEKANLVIRVPVTNKNQKGEKDETNE